MDDKHNYITRFCVHCGEPARFSTSCGERTCPDCRKKWFGRHFNNLKPIVSRWDRVYFLSLTLKNIPDGGLCKSDLNRLRKSFAALRKRVNGAISAGWYILQMTNEGNGWHLHLHAIYRGSYIPTQKISRLWHEITGDSFIVDIRIAERWEGALRYVLKDFLQSPRIRPEDEKEYNSIFFGSRMVQGFGEYAKLSFKKPYLCPKCGGDSWDTIENLTGEPRRYFPEWGSAPPS